MSDYRDDVLMDIEWLKQHLDDAHLGILDVRAGDPRLPFGYRMGHVPGAVALDVGRDFFVYGNGAPLSTPRSRRSAIRVSATMTDRWQTGLNCAACRSNEKSNTCEGLKTRRSKWQRNKLEPGR